MRWDEEDRVYEASELERLEALLHYFGWQGGTIHQLAKETGCSVDQLLSGRIEAVQAAEAKGFSAIRTCSKDWRVEKLVAAHQGDWPYWGGVIAGYWATGALNADLHARFVSISEGSPFSV